MGDILVRTHAQVAEEWEVEAGRIQEWAEKLKAEGQALQQRGSELETQLSTLTRQLDAARATAEDGGDSPPPLRIRREASPNDERTKP